MASAYFARRIPLGVIFGSFFVVLVPLLVLRAVPNFLTFYPYLAVFEAIVLGRAHFFVTLTLYLQSSHLDHFRSSVRNRVIFFIVPAAILLGSAALAAAPPVGEATFYIAAAIRAADFLHVGRQSFGMLQLFKRSNAPSVLRWQRPAENVFFIAMAGLQWVTFTFAGQLQMGIPWVKALVLGLAVLGAVILGAHLVVSLRQMGQPRAWIAPGYFAMQAFAAAMAAYRTELYTIGLTLHYVEYQVIMAPRCFNTSLDASRPLDRFFAALRATPVVFYGALLAIVLFSAFGGTGAADEAFGIRFITQIFNGIFLIHYFVDAFLWRFRDPFTAATLAPLYFRRDEPAAQQPAIADEPLRRNKWLLQSGACAALLLFALQVPAISAFIASRSAISSFTARQHRRWGIDYAKTGDLARARTHLKASLALAPQDESTVAALQWVESHLTSSP